MLREETASLHRQVEDDMDLPGAVQSRSDYVALLERLHGFHSWVESEWRAPQWAPDWEAIEVDLSRHLRTPQLTADLTALGVHESPVRASELSLSSFGEVLGSLYVMEGSALGGRMLAPHMRAAAGEVPTTFFDSAGRDHPKPWRAVKVALNAYEERTGDHARVLAGARTTFQLFGVNVGRATRDAVR